MFLYILAETCRYLQYKFKSIIVFFEMNHLHSILCKRGACVCAPWFLLFILACLRILFSLVVLLHLPEFLSANVEL